MHTSGHQSILSIFFGSTLPCLHHVVYLKGACYKGMYLGSLQPMLGLNHEGDSWGFVYPFIRAI